MRTMFVWSFILALFASAQHPPAAPAAPGGPVVVELFTSQGCGMCPDANRLLAEMGEADGSDVLALAYGVSYWDMYGWEDRYARPEFNARQQAYVDAGEAHRVYTPQFVINGAPTKFRFRPAVIREAVEQTVPVALEPALERIAPASVIVSFDGPARDEPAEVWLAAYEPGLHTMPIAAGSNAGLEMPHFNMVRALTALPAWGGGDYDVLDETACPAGLACAVLIQAPRGGPILGAASIGPAAAD